MSDYTVVVGNLRVVNGVYFKSESTIAVGVTQGHADNLIRKHWGASAHLTHDTDKLGVRYYRNGEPVTYDVWNAGR